MTKQKPSKRSAGKVQKPKKSSNLNLWGFRNSTKQVKLLLFALTFAVVGGSIYLWQSKASGGYEVQNTVIIPALQPTKPALILSEIAEQGNISATLFYTSFGQNVSLHFRDSTTGKTSQIELGQQQAINTWQDGDIVWSGNDLWLAGGTGPIYLRHYTLSGSPLPTTATPVSTQTYGNADSRTSGMIQLNSGTIVLAWHQQEYPSGYSFVTRPISTGVWGTPMPVNFMPSYSSKQSLVQHPTDGSIWMFSIPDAWGRMGVANLNETPTGLKINWTKSEFTGPEDGTYNVDAENAHVVAKPDPSTGTIVVAYQGNLRNHPDYPESYFSIEQKTWYVSYPTIMRVTADGQRSFTHLPIWVERVEQMNLVVRPGEVWLGYSPVDLTTKTQMTAEASRLTSAGWDTPIKLGTKRYTGGFIYSSPSRPDFTFHATDDTTLLARIVPIGTPDVLAPPVSAVTTPPNGATVSGTVNISASASDPAGIARVDFLTNGGFRYTDTTAPYSYSWNTTNLTNGTYTVSVRVYGTNGNVGTSAPITVTVNNSGSPPSPTDTLAPSVTISSPINNQTVSRKVTIKATGTDNVAVTKMEVFIDGALKSSVNGLALSYSWNVGAKQVAKGQHTILVKAYDAKGNVGEASIVVTK